MTKEEFHSILQTPDDRCDGWQTHLKERWRQGNMKAVFEITGLDFSDLYEKPIGATSINKPLCQTKQEQELAVANSFATMLADFLLRIQEINKESIENIPPLIKELEDYSPLYIWNIPETGNTGSGIENHSDNARG